MTTVSDRIRAQMERLSMSYGELSQLTGLSKSAVHRYATGGTDKVPTEDDSNRHAERKERPKNTVENSVCNISE